MSYKTVKVQTDNSDLEISRGNIQNLSTVNKFGKTANVDRGVNTDIWDGAGNTITYVAPTVARIHNIVSDSASDASAGVGARTVKIYGLTAWNAKEVSEIITLNGITNVPTVNAYVFIHRMKVLTSGATSINVGAISAIAATDSSVSALIGAGVGQTLMAIYAIPSGYNFFMSKYYISAIKGTASLAVEGTLLVNDNPDAQLTNFLTKSIIGITTKGTNYAERTFSPNFKITGPAIIKVRGNASADNTNVSAGFDGALEKIAKYKY